MSTALEALCELLSDLIDISIQDEKTARRLQAKLDEFEEAAEAEAKDAEE